MFASFVVIFLAIDEFEIVAFLLVDCDMVQLCFAIMIVPLVSYCEYHTPPPMTISRICFFFSEVAFFDECFSVMVLITFATDLSRYAVL